MSYQAPISFIAIRKALVRAVTSATRFTCIVEEPDTQNSPRPPLPYLSMKITTAAAKSGDDTTLLTEDRQNWNTGGQRRMNVSFHAYAVLPEDAYSHMCLWQGCLEIPSVQEFLRRNGIAVWVIGSVADVSQLLNTGYEGRSQMDVSFGIASNIETPLTDPGTIDTAEVEGTIQVGETETEIDFTAP